MSLRSVFRYFFDQPTPMPPMPPRTPVPANKIRICVAAFQFSHRAGRAHYLASEVAALHGDQYETWFYFNTPTNYYKFLQEFFDPIPFPDRLKGHDTSPFVWLETGNDNKMELLGGLDDFQKYCSERFKEPTILDQCVEATAANCFFAMWHNTYGPPQTYDKVNLESKESIPKSSL